MAKNNSTPLASQEAKVKNWIIGISIAIPLAVAVLLFMPAKLTSLGGWVYFLPHLNAVINSAASIALVVALVFVKQKKYSQHGATMTVAFILGAIFLVSYVIYHGAAESTPFGGEGTIRMVYYFLLISHILLSIGVVRLVLKAIYFALSGNIVAHKAIVKWAYPIWLYVSVSGVIVYLLISPYYV